MRIADLIFGRVGLIPVELRVKLWFTSSLNCNVLLALTACLASFSSPPATASACTMLSITESTAVAVDIFAGNCRL